VDFGQTGEVRYVCADHISSLLDLENLVVVSNLGSTANGHVLNCNIYEVATAAATALRADKLIFYTLNDIERLDLPRWLKLGDAEGLIRQFAYTRLRERDRQGEAAAAVPESASETPVNLDNWFVDGVPWELSCAVSALRSGVKRAHLIDIRDSGGLLLELYSRDGIGTMVSRDFYEGCRPARSGDPGDLGAVEALLGPLMAAGVLAPRTSEEIARDLGHFYMIERDAKVLACASLVPLSASMAEVGAFVVDPTYRGDGRGDALLEYLEEEAMSRGLTHLVLLTTRTADWFMQRGFQHAGSAHESDMLPPSRQARVVPGRNSQLYFKELGTDESEGDRIDGTQDLKLLWKKGLA